MPGEPEERAYKQRSEAGVYIEEATWGRLKDLAQARNVSVPPISEESHDS